MQPANLTRAWTCANERQIARERDGWVGNMYGEKEKKAYPPGHSTTTTSAFCVSRGSITLRQVLFSTHEGSLYWFGNHPATFACVRERATVREREKESIFHMDNPSPPIEDHLRCLYVKIKLKLTKADKFRNATVRVNTDQPNLPILAVTNGHRQLRLGR